MNGAPHLYQRRVAPGDLAAAVDAFEEDLRYLYFESEAEIELVAYASPQPAWTHGRAFGPRLEVRWQRAGDGFDLLLLTEADGACPAGWEPLPAGSPAAPCPDSADPEGQVLLWGTHIGHLERPHRLAGGSEQAWIETRIPRALRYPVDGAPRWVRARTIVYRCQGQPVLTRLVCLEGEDHEPRPL